MTGITWTSGSVASGGEDIYYEVAGSGTHVVVLGHGLACPSTARSFISSSVGFAATSRTPT